MFEDTNWLATIAASCAAFALGPTLDAQTVDLTGTASLSPYGIGADHHTSGYPEKWAPQMAAIGIKMNRSCHINWDAVEPEEGKWNWKDVDRQMNCMGENHIESGGVLLGNPAWTKTRGLPSRNLAAWSIYVTECVKHLKGKVRYWEVWNEPPNFTKEDQTPADYAKIVVSAYAAIKAVDPTAQVGLAAKSVHVNYLEQVIKAGAKDHFDYVTIHPYEVLDGIATDIGTEAIYMHIVPTMRKMLAAQDPAKVNAPVWFTEFGHEAVIDDDVQASSLVKAYTMGIAEGVACLCWFECMDGDSGPMGLLDADGKPRPSYTALGRLIEQLGPHPTFVGWVLLGGRDYGFVFDGARGAILSAWGRKGESDHVDFGQSVRIVDAVTGRVSEASGYDMTTVPVLVSGVPGGLIAQAQANRTRPFPWGGDYTHAASVSVAMGERNIERGLHTQSGNAVAKAVVAYGGPARAGSIPGGTTFMVDPNFLCYDTTPIEITVVVRRDEANDNAGFKLKYESTNGFRDCGWYTVPDNKEWHTMSWKINDAQFVNYWGYNFALESDGDKYDKYLIQSVTVTKVAR